MKKIPDKHIFVCVNCRDDLRKSCGDEGLIIRNKLKNLLLLSNSDKNIRINKSGCLNQCESGPIMVVYPNKIWYKNISIDDCEEIFTESILKDKIINRLYLKDKDNNS
tara:strand:- start:243 stop:566 length:324 start_codon:yes stop_codon:yes gene_type:complete